MASLPDLSQPVTLMNIFIWEDIDSIPSLLPVHVRVSMVTTDNKEVMLALQDLDRLLEEGTFPHGSGSVAMHYQRLVLSVTLKVVCSFYSPSKSCLSIRPACINAAQILSLLK